MIRPARPRRPGLPRTAAGALLALTFGASTTPAAATPLPLDQCTTTSGVVLAVDFGPWGGPLLRSCGTTPTTGYTLLNQGGWKSTGTSHDGPAFICRIGYSGHDGGRGYPTPEQDRCVQTSPTTAYWSYWYADPGENTWTYSQLGAVSHRPLPGSVELWVHGKTDLAGTQGRPAISPDSVRAHNTTPGGAPATTTTPPPPASGGTTTGPTATQPAPGATKPTTSPTTPPTRGVPTPSATPDGATPTPGTSVEPPPSPPSDPTSPTPTPTDVPAPSASSPTPVDAAPAADAPRPTGSMVPAVVGAAVVLVLGVATAVTALRRRRRAE
ncbi:hypothetical protein [Kitasatospora sp. NPDC004289]